MSVNSITDNAIVSIGRLRPLLSFSSSFEKFTSGERVISQIKFFLEPDGYIRGLVFHWGRKTQIRKGLLHGTKASVKKLVQIPEDQFILDFLFLSSQLGISLIKIHCSDGEQFQVGNSSCDIEEELKSAHFPLNREVESVCCFFQSRICTQIDFKLT